MISAVAVASRGSALGSPEVALVVAKELRPLLMIGEGPWWLFDAPRQRRHTLVDTDNSGDGTAKPIGRDETPNGNIEAMQERKSAVVELWEHDDCRSGEKTTNNRATDKEGPKGEQDWKKNPAKISKTRKCMGWDPGSQALDDRGRNMVTKENKGKQPNRKGNEKQISGNNRHRRHKVQSRNDQ
nr:hypothetical protein Iba_chr03dCG1850 [Ipomoea batatas]